MAPVNQSYLSELEKCSSDVGLVIVGKLTEPLSVEPADVIRRPSESAGAGNVYLGRHYERRLCDVVGRMLPNGIPPCGTG
jgi:hypothetical protein